MSKKIIGLLSLLVFFFLAGVVLAQTLTLTRIGSLSTVGVDYSYVNYLGPVIPTLEGTASPSAQVLIYIKTSTDATVAASPSGAWQFTPGVLDPGPSTIQIVSGTESISFTLNFNATPTATLTPTAIPEELPAAGVWEYYIIIVGLGASVLFLGGYIKKRMLLWEGREKSS